MSAVIDNPAEHRFELLIEDSDGDIAAAYYRHDGNGRIVLTHTIVPPEYSGRGLAGTLATGVFGMARARGDRLVLQCPYMTAWYAKHPDYADIVVSINSAGETK